MSDRYINGRCALCANSPVTYVKTRGGFHKVCIHCREVLESNGLLVEPNKVFALNKEKAEVEEIPSSADRDS